MSGEPRLKGIDMKAAEFLIGQDGQNNHGHQQEFREVEATLGKWDRKALERKAEGFE